MRRMKWLNRARYALAVTAAMVFTDLTCDAQTADGNAGLTSATTAVAGYFTNGANLMYAIGAVSGLIGAVKVYQKWNTGDHDTGKIAAAWFGSCIFLVVVATILKSFFGV
jgi:hypothetical protein